jgi:hypothetical protein
MITTAIGAVVAVWYFGGAVLNVRDMVILKPEALKLHAEQAELIAQNRAGIDYFKQAQIANINREIGSLNELIRQKKAGAYELQRLQSLQDELKALQKAK